MSDTQFDRFVNFVECKRRYVILRASHEELQGQLKVLEDDFAARQKALDDEREQVELLKREMRLVEIEGKSFREREKEIRRKLPVVTNQKEYTALTNELADVERLQNANEDRLLSLFENSEQKNTDLEKGVGAFNAWQDDQSKQQKHLADEGAVVAKQLEEQEAACLDLEKLVNAEQLAEYKRMAGTLGDPVVPLHERHCSACSFAVAHKDLDKLRRHILLQCQNCYRMLYERLGSTDATTLSATDITR